MFLSKDKNLLQTLQSIVRSERDVASLSKCWTFNDKHFLLKVYLTYLEYIVRNAHVFLSKEKNYLIILQSIVRSYVVGSSVYVLFSLVNKDCLGPLVGQKIR